MYLELDQTLHNWIGLGRTYLDFNQALWSFTGIDHGSKNEISLLTPLIALHREKESRYPPSDSQPLQYSVNELEGFLIVPTSTELWVREAEFEAF